MSGRLVIIGIVSIALAAAAASWWFRYAATHRALEFWGPETARLIRDAPTVELNQSIPPVASPASGTGGFLDSADGSDISHAPGLTHLRNALLEDRSFAWPPRPTTPRDTWHWLLLFRDARSNEAVFLWFSRDWKYVSSPVHRQTLSCEPISAGLAKMLGELVPAEEAAR
ncbi:MAG: hypothetical protein WD738_08510 [Pirellulales bacterium]